MCSVIEIKNNDEYYIRYHSPDSMVEHSLADKKDQKDHENNNSKEQTIKDRAGSNSGGSDDGTHTTSGDSGHQRDILSNSPKSQTEDQLINELTAEKCGNHRPYDFLKSRNKDVDVTSDRGSSEESIIDGKERMNANNPDADVSKRKTKYNRAANNKKAQNRRSASIEKVPITINSHIPASPERLISQQKTLTHDTGTQIESAFEETSSNCVADDVLEETNATISSSDNYGHTNPIGQDKEKENKQARNDSLLQRDDRFTDNDQEFQKQEINALKQGNANIENKNGISRALDTHLVSNSKFLKSPGMDIKPGQNQQMSSNLKDGVKKKSFLCRSSANHKNKGTSSSVLPIQLEEKHKDSSSSILKQSNIPILIKKETSTKRKLSSLMGNSSSKSSTNNDCKDKNVKKEIKKSKSNSDISLDANSNKSRKGSTKSNAQNEKKKTDSNGKEREGQTTKISKISPIAALSNQCKNGFGKKKNKNPLDANHDKEHDNKPLSKKKNSSEDKKNDKDNKKDKMVVKKSFSMDSIGDIYKSNPKNDPELPSKRLDHREHSFHHSQSQIDQYQQQLPDQQSFFEQHPHAVLKAAKTKDGYTVYGSGKKWTLDGGKFK